MPRAQNCNAFGPRHLRSKRLQLTGDCRLTFGFGAHLGSGIGKRTVCLFVVGTKGQASGGNVALDDRAADFGRQVGQGKGEAVAVLYEGNVIPLQPLTNPKGC